MFPTILAVIHWLVHIAMYNEHLANSTKSHSISGDNMFIYTLNTYLLYIRGNDDAIEGEDENFMEKLHQVKSGDLKDLEAKLETMKSGPSEFDPGGNSVFLHSCHRDRSISHDPCSKRFVPNHEQILKLEGEISYIPVVRDINNKCGNEEGSTDKRILPWMVDGAGLPLNVADLLPTLVKLTKKVTEQVRLLAGHYIGNDVIDENAAGEGIYDYYWTYALNYDETNAGITKYCGYGSGNFSAECLHYQSQSGSEYGDIDIYNIYAPFCDGSIHKHPTRSVKNFDPCSDDYVLSYLNRADVQEALRVRNTSWGFCIGIGMIDSPTTILPIITQLIENGISIYSGDTDGRVLVTSSSSVKPDVLEEEGEGDFGRSQPASDALSKEVSKQILELYEQNKVAPAQTSEVVDGTTGGG
ncbi:unnamed protein product [Lactuca saligna]|uniref:Uncharacterized protein n=1 Tax=Lactuca saligna TaxID=75948 RepID=A0AA36E0Z0_LACSI|nr:unnamed protein product [Lactuca saligna]